MTRYIRITNCSECPHKDHSGGFTKGGSIPLCNLVEGKKYRYGRRELPVTRDYETGDRVHTNKIPSWCPLENVRSK